MKSILDYENLCIAGDIHGKFEDFEQIIHEKYNLENTAFIIAGDIGLGFYDTDYYKKLYDKLEKSLEKYNNCILGIRGNHDNPDCFNRESNLFIDFPRLKAIPDYDRLTWKDRSILCIGGATSIDKEYRFSEMKENPDQILWWENENIDERESELKIKEDIVISHEAPMCIGPVLIRKDNMSLDTYRNILTDRLFLDKIIKDTNPNNYYFGHYHETYIGYWEDTKYNGLDINEIVEVCQRK